MHYNYLIMLGRQNNVTSASNGDAIVVDTNGKTNKSTMLWVLRLADQTKFQPLELLLEHLQW